MKNKIHKIVIISGKGGTGKTTISAALSKLIQEKVIIDCDVDAADLFILLNPKEIEKKDFYSSKLAEIIEEKCIKCNLCETYCRFEAISNYKVDSISCEGCGFCYNICPANAIVFESRKTGDFFITKAEDDSHFLYAKLLPGLGNSGKLVSELKKNATSIIADNNFKNEIIDGPPGIGCPVNASITGSNYVLIVAEPTVSGISDLKRLIDLLKLFKIKSGIIINKYDLNITKSEEIKSLANMNNITFLGSLSYDIAVIKALQQKLTILDTTSKVKEEILSIYENLIIQLNN